MPDDQLTLSGDYLTDLPGLAAALNRPQDEVSRYINPLLGDDTRQALETFRGKDHDARLRDLLVRDLNKIIDGASIYTEQRFPSTMLRPETKRLVKLNPQGSAYRRLLNRLLLEDAYPLMLRRLQDRPFTIEELKANVEDAWTEAYRKLSIIGKQTLTRITFARNLPLSEQDFEDIINVAAAETHANIAKCDSVKGVIAYFRKAATSKAFDLVRQEMARKRGEGQVTVTPDLSDFETAEEEGRKTLLDEVDPNLFDWTALEHLLPSVGPLPIYEAHVTDMRRVIADAQKELEKSDQELLADTYEHGLTQNEIGRKSNKSTKQIGSEIARAREKLARRLPVHFKKEMKELYGRKRVSTS